MKLILFCTAFFCTSICFAQSVLDIEYERFPLKDIDKNGLVYKATYERNNVRMLVNDSFAFVYHFERGNDFEVKKKATVAGNKLINHAIFFDFGRKEFYSMYNLSPNQKFLLLDSTKLFSWRLLEGEKKLLGYNCKPAVTITAKGDSILVWYTNELAFQQGGLLYDGVPGIVLEAYDQSVWEDGVGFRAIKIKERTITQVRPEKYKKLTLQEWGVIKKQKNFHVP